MDIAHREERGQWKEMQTIHKHIDTLLNEKYQCKKGSSQFKQENIFLVLSMQEKHEDQEKETMTKSIAKQVMAAHNQIYFSMKHVFLVCLFFMMNTCKPTDPKLF